MKWSAAAYLGWSLLVLPMALAAGDRRLSAAEESTTVGRQYFERYCSSCHGMDGEGNGPVAPLLRTPPADLTRIAERRGGQFPEAEISSYINGRADVRAHGSRDMPVWGERFSSRAGGGSLGEEVARGNLVVLMQYLRAIQR